MFGENKMKNTIEKKLSENSRRASAREKLLSRFRNNPELIYEVSPEEDIKERVERWNKRLSDYKGPSNSDATWDLFGRGLGRKYFSELLKQVHDDESYINMQFIADIINFKPSDEEVCPKILKEFKKFGGHEKYKEKLSEAFAKNPKKLSNIIGSYEKGFDERRENVVQAKDYSSFTGGKEALYHYYAYTPCGIPSAERMIIDGLICLDFENKGIVKSEHYERLDSKIGKLHTTVTEKWLDVFEGMGNQGTFGYWKPVLINMSNIAWNYGFRPENLAEKINSIQDYRGNWNEYKESLKNYLEKNQ